MTQTRGIRNNNPMNIRKSGSTWLGKIVPSHDPDFEQFDTPVDGIRAGAKILINYRRHDGLSTIAQIIGRWAPGTENNTGSYIDDVCKRCDTDSGSTYDVFDATSLAALVAAIIVHENGSCPYTSDVISEGVSEALA